MIPEIKAGVIDYPSEYETSGYYQTINQPDLIAIFLLKILPWVLALLLMPAVACAQTQTETKQAIVNKLMGEGLRLRKDGTKSSLEASIPKFIEALTVIRSMGDRPYEANILFVVGSTYRQLGENQKSIEYFAKALPLFRATNNQKSEAITLNNLGDVDATWAIKKAPLSITLRLFR
jgi:tetratricopeptide (TPR) repeat protein